ncbi:MAG: hypothetical protein AAF928_00455 [Myxococcota bacterium]
MKAGGVKARGKVLAVGVAAVVAILVVATTRDCRDGPKAANGGASGPPDGADSAFDPEASSGAAPAPRDNGHAAAHPTTRGPVVEAAVVAGHPCRNGQILVRSALADAPEGASLTVGQPRGALAVVHVPARGGPAEGLAHIPVRASLGSDTLAASTLELELQDCPGRLIVVTEVLGDTQARILTSVFGDFDRDGPFRYDFGDGQSEVTSDRDVVHDYGADAEGREFVITVSLVEATEEGADPQPAATPGAKGFGVVRFPDLTKFRETLDAIDELQREHDASAARRGLD